MFYLPLFVAVFIVFDVTYQNGYSFSRVTQEDITHPLDETSILHLWLDFSIQRQWLFTSVGLWHIVFVVAYYSLNVFALNVD